MNKVVLKIPQIIKLHTFYVGLGIDVLKLPRREIAEMATAALEFEVTDSNVESIERALGVERSRRAVATSSNDDVAVVARILQFLLTEMGIKVPAELSDILERAKKSSVCYSQRYHEGAPTKSATPWLDRIRDLPAQD